MNETEQRRQKPDLNGIQQTLAELYAAEYPKGAPELFQRLLPRLPDYIRALVKRKLNLIVQDEVDADVSYEQLDTQQLTAISMFLNQQVLRAHRDVGRDSTLSNDEHDIAHFDTVPPIIAHELIKAAAGAPRFREEEQGVPAKELQRIGCVFFDVDGTKTIVDCTSHAHAGKYLEGIGKFLSKPPASVSAWLVAHDLKSDAYSVAGDEFIVMLRSENGPVEQEMLDEFGSLVREEMKRDAELTAYVSFDDPEFIMEYDKSNWNKVDREAYEADPQSMAAKLKNSRDKLPDAFFPSVSSGSATFIDGLNEALSPATEEAKTLEELGINASRLMAAQADAKLKEDKKEFRANLTDEKWKAFLLRNEENRILAAENAELRHERAEQRERFGEKRRDAERLLAGIGMLSKEIGTIPEGIAAVQEEARACLKRCVEADDLLALEQVVELKGKLEGWCECLVRLAA